MHFPTAFFYGLSQTNHKEGWKKITQPSTKENGRRIQYIYRQPMIVAHYPSVNLMTETRPWNKD